MGLAHAPYGWRLPPEVPHTAQLLARAGYTTALVGMQHLIERGSAHELGYQRVSRLRPPTRRPRPPSACCASSPHRAEPFYLEVGFEEPHRPYDFGGAVPDTSRGVSVPGYLPDVPEAQPRPCRVPGRHSTDGRRRRPHPGCPGRAGLTESTCVVFVTDHGAAMPRAKCTLYDPGIRSRAPVALAIAEGSAAGASISRLVSNVDVTPTLLDGLGLAIPARRAGSQLWPLLQGSADRVRDEVFAEKTFHTYYEPMRAIRTERHKLIVNFEVSTRVDVPSDIRQSPIYPVMQAEFDAVRAPHRVVRPGRRTRGSDTTWRAGPSWRRSKPSCARDCSHGCASPRTHCSMARSRPLTMRTPFRGSRGPEWQTRCGAEPFVDPVRLNSLSAPYPIARLAAPSSAALLLTACQTNHACTPADHPRRASRGCAEPQSGASRCFGGAFTQSPCDRGTFAERLALAAASPSPVAQQTQARLRSQIDFDQYPFAAMIDNIAAARPQFGLDGADVVYEAPAEGGIPRLMPVYLRSGVDVRSIGPVRSARDYFVDLANEYRVALVHIGASPQGFDALHATGLPDLDEQRGDRGFTRVR